MGKQDSDQPVPKDAEAQTVSCTDFAIIDLALRRASELAGECTTATVILTSACPEDGHGVHVTTAVVNRTGGMSPRETEAVCKRLRSLADDLWTRFCSAGNVS